MKTIGLIGGMSWESSLAYYRTINETVKRRLGGLHSAKSIMYSVDFAEVETLQHQGRWPEAAKLMVKAAQGVERAGADLLVLCTNTMHKLADDIENSIQVPFLHIADATAEKVRSRGMEKVGLLGTRFTMEEAFYCGRLTDRHGLGVVTPDESGRALVHRVIYDELCLGVVSSESRARCVEVINNLVASGAEGIVLGCTELELLIEPKDVAVELFPTAKIHAQAAVERAL